jgi:cytochrome o ubiquinol oxidase operon protein cyoD
MSAHDLAPEEGHFTPRAYVTGFVAAALLTAIPFWLVMARPIEDATITGVVIVALAVAQILVHTFAFLHVNTRAQGGWTLIAYVFTAVLLLITIAGSVWIMYHLNSNMMPGMKRDATIQSQIP